MIHTAVKKGRKNRRKLKKAPLHMSGLFFYLAGVYGVLFSIQALNTAYYREGLVNIMTGIICLLIWSVGRYARKSRPAISSSHVLSSGHASSPGYALNSGHPPRSGHALNSGHALRSGHALSSGHALRSGHDLRSGHAPSSSHVPSSGHILISRYAQLLEYGVCLVPAVLATLLALRHKEQIAAQIWCLAESFTGKMVLEIYDATGAVLLMTVYVAVLFFFFEFIVEIHTVPCLFILIIMLAFPVLDIDMNGITVFLLTFYQLSFAAVRAIRLYQPGSKPFESIKTDMGYKNGLYMGAVLLLFFVVGYLVISSNHDKFIMLTEAVEGNTIKMMDRVTASAQEQSRDGSISRRNTYPAGEVRLEIRVSKEPSETLYLRGFTGGDYNGEEWLKDRDANIFLMQNGNRDYSDWINIQHIEDNIHTKYFPYYCRPDMPDISLPELGYNYTYFEQNEMIALTYSTETYKQEMTTVYTRVPKEQLPRLTTLCEQNPLEDRESITAFILHTLHNNAVYTQTPGNMPANQNTVEYFLFESGRGYCVHFASAAVLMYRIYGIPARYVTGYAIRASDFEQEEKGIYYAAVTDASAHAWAEIYLDEYGWIPIEATPGDSGLITCYPGFSSQELEEIMKKISLPDAALQEEQTNLTNRADDNIIVDAVLDDQLAKPLFFVFLLTMPLCLIDYRQRKMRREIEAMDSRGLFNRFMEMLYFAGWKQDETGTEQDFPDKLTEKFPELSSGEIRVMITVLTETAFGKREINRNTDIYVRYVYRQAASSLYLQFNWYQKIIFRYFRGFG